ncbi:MAG TPA: hypothetical protein ENN21_08830 [Spirochaetes bacterium]|nr:hypothetical protein [Spirochaetota bacterium]
MTGQMTGQDQGRREPYSFFESESLIKEKIGACGAEMSRTIDACMEKARSEGREKFLSEVVTLRGKIERIQGEAAREGAGARYKIEHLSEADKNAIRETDEKLLSALGECAGLLDAFACSGMSMDSVDRYSALNAHLEELRRLFQERALLFKKLQVFG